MKKISSYRLLREKQFSEITDNFTHIKFSNLIACHKIDRKLFNKLKKESEKFLNISKKYNLSNMTPNGKLMPKRENEKIFNNIVTIYRDIIMSLNFAHLIKKWVVPAIRYKESNTNKLNLKRSSRTELPHSDSWAGWGDSCILVQIPILGDIKNNRVDYYEIPSDLKKDWMKEIKFDKAKKFVSKCKKLKHHYKSGYIYICDISVVHSTKRLRDSKPRMSIDIPLILKSTNNINKKFKSDIISNNKINLLNKKYKINCPVKMGKISEKPISFKYIK